MKKLLLLIPVMLLLVPMAFAYTEIHNEIINMSYDTYVDQQNPDTNYGRFNYIYIRGQEGLNLTSYLMFNNSGNYYNLSNSTIYDAELWCNVTIAEDVDFVYAYYVNGSWEEDTTTYNTLNPFSDETGYNTTVLDKQAGGSLGWMRWNITNATQLAVTKHLFNTSIGLLTYEIDGTIMKYYSKDQNTTGQCYVNVTYVYPEINLTFYDEILKTLIKEKVTVDIAGEYNSKNYSTTNGSIIINNVQGDEVRITYSSDKYKARNYYFYYNTINNQTDLYLLSLTNSTDVILEVKDESGNLLEDATVYLMRYYVDTNSYITVAMEKTNPEGQVIFDVDFDDAFYKFYAIYGDYSELTAGSKIFSTDILIRIDTLVNPFSGIDAINRVTSNITFNNYTQTFSYFFIDNDGYTRTATLEVYNGGTTVCSNTATAVSGTVLCQYNTTNSTHITRAVGYIDGSLIPTAATEVYNKVIEQAQDIFGKSGMFYTIMFAGSVAGLGMFSIATAVILFIAGLAAMMFMGVGYIQLGVYVTIIIMGILVVWRVRQ